MLTTDQACKLAGISYKRADHWTRLGLVFPEGEARPGSGIARRWSIDEMFVLLVVADLMRLGAGAEASGRVAEWLRMTGTSETSGRVFVSRDGWIVDEPRESCYVLDLTALRATLDERAAALTAA